MKVSTGQVVVHPHHGPATVTQVVTRVVRDEPRRYLKLSVHNTDLAVAVPMERAEEIGVRPVVDADGVREIFDVLLAPSGAQDNLWSRRIKANAERLRSGDILTIAALIRDLTRSNDEKPLSFGEGKMLRDALAPFVSELALALSQPEDEVAAIVEAAVLHGTRPAIPVSELAAAS